MFDAHERYDYDNSKNEDSTYLRYRQNQNQHTQAPETQEDGTMYMLMLFGGIVIFIYILAQIKKSEARNQRFQINTRAPININSWHITRQFINNNSDDAPSSPLENSSLIARGININAYGSTN